MNFTYTITFPGLTAHQYNIIKRDCGDRLQRTNNQWQVIMHDSLPFNAEYIKAKFKEYASDVESELHWYGIQMQFDLQEIY